MGIISANAIWDTATSDTGPMWAVVEGSACSWWNLDGTGTIAERDSINVTTFTDNGTGDYRFTFTVAFSTDDYGCICHSNDSSGVQEAIGTSFASADFLTSRIDTLTYNWNDELAEDGDTTCGEVYGRLT